MGPAEETNNVDVGSDPDRKQDKPTLVVKRCSLRLVKKGSKPNEVPQDSPEDIPPKRAKVELGLEKTPMPKSEEDPSSSGEVSSSKARERKVLARKNIKSNKRPSIDESDKEETPDAASRNAIYQIKWVVHNNRNTPIVTQNENGPCPLLSVVNVLFLQGRLVIEEGTLEMTEEELLTAVNSAILKTVSKNDNPNPNLVQNAQDAISLLPEIISGLNVNINFSGVKSFEYTRECLIFDILRIPLYHGWLLDPQSAEVAQAVGNLSYNQLIDQIIQKKTSPDPDIVAEALIAENFLETTASQLTVHGLCELHTALNDGDYGIFFRNNHFNVICKHKNTLCQLVTDQGYLEESSVVWETLSTISGDELFLNSEFQSCTPQRSSCLNAAEEQQISRDFLVALSLQDEQTKQQDKEFGWDAYGNALGAMGMTSDEELARHIFHEEQRNVATPKSETTSPDESTSSMAKSSQEEPRARGWKCIIC